MYVEIRAPNSRHSDPRNAHMAILALEIPVDVAWVTSGGWPWALGVSGPGVGSRAASMSVIGCVTPYVALVARILDRHGRGVAEGVGVLAAGQRRVTATGCAHARRRQLGHRRRRPEGVIPVVVAGLVGIGRLGARLQGPRVQAGQQDDGSEDADHPEPVDLAVGDDRQPEG